jgi:F0F1-type ATP synthase assembly protein I
MTGQTDPETPHHVFTDEEMAAIDANKIDLRRWNSRDRVLPFYLGVAFVVGLIAHVIGYLLKSSALTEPFGLLAELLYAFGFALWTGVVITLFVEVLPQAKLRQVNQALAEYEEWKKQRAATRRP